MHIVRNSIETRRGPDEWFTGEGYIDTIAVPSEDSVLSASSVHFAPKARSGCAGVRAHETNIVHVEDQPPADEQSPLWQSGGRPGSWWGTLRGTRR